MNSFYLFLPLCIGGYTKLRVWAFQCFLLLILCYIRLFLSQEAIHHFLAEFVPSYLILNLSSAVHHPVPGALSHFQPPVIENTCWSLLVSFIIVCVCVSLYQQQETSSLPREGFFPTRLQKPILTILLCLFVVWSAFPQSIKNY